MRKVLTYDIQVELCDGVEERRGFGHESDARQHKQHRNQPTHTYIHTYIHSAYIHTYTHTYIKKFEQTTFKKKLYVCMRVYVCM